MNERERGCKQFKHQHRHMSICALDVSKYAWHVLELNKTPHLSLDEEDSASKPWRGGKKTNRKDETYKQLGKA